MDGIIVVDKPSGYTSFDIVAIIRRLSGERRVGHTGTLDPMATGVLPVLLGSATKVQIFMENTDKVYEAEMKLGITTDTQDITGKLLSESSVYVTEEEIIDTLNRFKGNISQIPPMYSAVKMKGKKLYELAREGKEVERETRKVNIISNELINFEKESNIVKIRVKCSKGTYIRTLCSDMGQYLGCGATLSALRRTESNGFSISDSVTLDKIKEYGNSEKLESLILSLDRVFERKRELPVTYPQAVRFTNGGGLMLSRLPLLKDMKEGEILRIYFKNKLLGLGVVNLEKEEISVLKVLCKDIPQ